MMHEFYRYQMFMTGFFVALFFFLVIIVKMFMISSWKAWQKSPDLYKTVERPKYQLLETEASDNNSV
ncbi:MAG: hypothetical protein ACYCXG_10380 [Acidiferrobacter sp.]